MQATETRQASRDRHWIVEIAVVALLMPATLLLFGVTELDTAMARLFFRPEHPGNVWPFGAAPLWRFFYHAAPAITGALGFTALWGLVRGWLRPAAAHYRRHALFVLLTVALGPGLVVNAVLKDHWSRPRPRQLVEFCGEYPHRRVHEPGANRDCKSFPCGHCSVGFAYCVFYFLLRNTRPRTACLALAASAAFGIVLGIGRMAAGAHFCSDVLWSGYLTFLVAWGLYYLVLRIPRHEQRKAEATGAAPRKPALIIAAGILLGVALLYALLLATPIEQPLSLDVGTDRIRRVRQVTIAADRADVTVRLVAATNYVLRLRGHARGFGLPINRIRRDLTLSRTFGTVEFDLEHRGVYTEIDTALGASIALDALEKLVIRVGKGNVRVQAFAPLPTNLVIDAITEEGEAVVPHR